MKNEKGITLVALVITIIVLIILAGISISFLLGEGGLINKAQQGAENYKKAESDEQTMLGEINTVIDSIATDISSNNDSNQNSARSLLISQLPSGATTFSSGYEVSLGGEYFFVLSDDGTNVKLLAKYCLSNTARSEQVTASDLYSNYGRTFSHVNYWSDYYKSGTLDLQSSEMLTLLGNTSDETTANNAILKAQEYGRTLSTTIGKTVKGRLMSHKEASDILNGTDEEMKKNLYGSWTVASEPSSQGWLLWWLGTAKSNYEAFAINGSGLCFGGYGDNTVGVRPVIEI